MPFLLLFSMLLLLFHSTLTIKGASNGLMLWFNSVLPSLLPFLILSSIIIKTNAAEQLSRLCSPLFKLLFISRQGCCAMLIGLIAGTPIGAKAACDLLKNGKIKPREAQYIAALISNPSPAFLISYVATQKLDRPYMGILIFVVLIISSLIGSAICTRLFYGLIKKSAAPLYEIRQEKVYGNFALLLDSSISDSFYVILKIGGYIILFSAFSEILLFYLGNKILPSFLAGILEITKGISLITSTDSLCIQKKIVLTSVLTAFGGFSCFFQTAGFLAEEKLSVCFHLICRIVCSAITLIITSTIMYLAYL